MKYRTTETFDAVQWRGDNFKEIEEFTHGRVTIHVFYPNQTNSLMLYTDNASRYVPHLSYIIKDERGDFHTLDLAHFIEYFKDVESPDTV